ncbi:penicillin-binding transpeptidase domain-containing protein [Merdimmobilis hominis]|jgi:penicillin-binding protein 2|uniref:Penicillin-binding protein 2B n=1 Tax=uncultured Anaerotruncus sp. TaxID=905011 RepID=A0A6N2UZV3_9FIRM|nr:penicillin-binding transpeptidase domain-containing protein [Merdimmobilis hominis]MCD4836921.1 penicillin-binding protein [Merdimmobilis hominis]PWL61715.1 MAG: penicillin-binding protein [Oscillospiraceae bacterium]
MKLSTQRSRVMLLSAALGVVLFIYIIRLMQLQIVQGEEYYAMVNRGTERSQVVEAARGEITDRYGRPFAVNRVGWNIVLDRAFLEKGRENETILKVINMLEETGESWIDNLPITEAAPFQFKEGYEAEVARLKKFAGVGESATVDDVLYWLTTERFHLEEYAPEDARKIAGVRYEMEQRGFSISTPYTFAEDISITTATKIKERGFELPGVDIQESAVREYVNDDLAPHIIGRIGPIYAEEYQDLKDKGYAMNGVIGKEGIEKQFEDQLRGQNGTRQIYLNSQGNVVEVTEGKTPVPGNTIMLTLDQKLQQVAKDALIQEIQLLNATAPVGQGREADAGAVAAIDVKTGEVLVLLSWPDYHLTTYNQDFSDLLKDERNPMFNRALMGEYTPGSIFKPTVATAALASGEIDESSTVFCGMKYTFFDDYQPGCLSFHRDINVITALQKSCNIFFYDVGRRIGIDRINYYASSFGMGQPTGIELPERVGRLSSPEFSKSVGETWTGGNVIQAAIGQKDTKLTPLQMANYTATLANDGKRMEVSIIKAVKDYTREETYQEHTPSIRQQVDASQEVFDVVRRGMIAASGAGGTSSATFGNYPISVASKTGTPETHQFPNSTFIAYAPADDPQIAVAVVIEKGWHGYTGAPVAKAIFDEYFSLNATPAQVPPKGELLP